MIENNLLESKIIQNTKNAYFANYMTKKDIQKMENSDFMDQIIENYDELSKNDWELHKKYIKEGHNPNEIAKIIRNDEIEKLQEITSQTDFDFDQEIEPSLFTKNGMKINDEIITRSAKIGNLFLVKYFLHNNNIPKDIIISGSKSGNVEVIQYILKQGKIDINAKDISLFYLIFILII